MDETCILSKAFAQIAWEPDRTYIKPNQIFKSFFLLFVGTDAGSGKSASG